MGKRRRFSAEFKREAVASSERLLAETKNRHKATVSGLRAEQRNEIEQLQTQVRDYAKALKAVAKSNGLENKEKRRQIRAQRAIWGLRRAIMRKGGNERVPPYLDGRAA